MRRNNRDISFPAVMKISFYKIIEKYEDIARDDDSTISDYAKGILSEVKQFPELSEGFDDISMLETHQDLISRLCRPLFPDVLLTNEIKALTPPFYFDAIYSSTRFDNVLAASGKGLMDHMSELDDDTFYMYCCYYILGAYYGFPVQAGGNLKINVLNESQGFERTYKLGINADLSEFIPTEKAVDISEDEFEYLVENFGNIDIWKEKFPPNSWIMKGVNMVNLMDVTIDQSLSMITSNLLYKSNDSFEKIKGQLKRLFNNSELEVGAINIDNTNMQRLEKEDVKSILLSKKETFHCKESMCDFTFMQLFNRKEPLVITDVEKFHESTPDIVSERLMECGFKSFIIAPLIHEGELLGMIELGSFKRYELNRISMLRLEEIIPILSLAHKRFVTESENEIEAIIQKECTTIHPSVKWRFLKEAKRFITKREQNEQAVFKDIIFKELYPLYGQLDIRSSSSIRNEAVKLDLTKQINSIKKILKSAHKKTSMPYYESVIYRINNYKKAISKGLSAGSEHTILEFLSKEVYPIFNHLERDIPELRKSIRSYNEMLDPQLHSVYEERKKYDNSVNYINQKLASFLDNKQEEAQKMFPHYFERYKTDGVEYNMYIGQSISPDNDFNPLYLNNLRLWQLLVMCEMEIEFRSIQKELDTPLEVASLILVYNTPISVHFRMDEKRFDVEGAYNARYEVIKKRVDKAHIAGTDERITEPGRIAIVYSQKEDADEYRKYISFLINKGYLSDEVEDLEVEPLQGVSGLRALRVKVNFQEAIGVNELMKAIVENQD